MLLLCCCFVQLLLHLVSGDVAEGNVEPLLRRKEFVTLHKWSELKLGVPEGYQQPPTLDANRYAQDKLLPVDVDVEYGDDGYHRTFLTIPRLSHGVLYSLAVVADSDNSTLLNPLLVPYPSYDWHSSFGQNCSSITSAIRTFVSVYNTIPQRINHIFNITSLSFLHAALHFVRLTTVGVCGWLTWAKLTVFSIARLKYSLLIWSPIS
uniref:Protein yellow n=1 Tax=Bactrocera dorsalis TaxID=27457 RepID=A0A034VMR4_BACDO